MGKQQLVTLTADQARAAPFYVVPAEDYALRAGGQAIWDMPAEERDILQRKWDEQFPGWRDESWRNMPSPVSSELSPDPTGKPPIDWSAITRDFA